MRVRWAIAGCAALLLMGCSGSDAPSSKGGGKASTSSDGGGTKEVGVNNTVRQPDNPAEREGVKVYRPKRLANTTYDQNKRTVVDLDTGDKLVVSKPIGPGDSPRQFGFSNEKTGGIAGGSFKYWSDNDVSVFEVTGISIAADEFKSYRAREEYDIGRIGEMFGALREAVYRKNQPLANVGFDKEIIVADSRPETISEINPQNGTRKAAR
jgi:hypothetical protein